MTANVMPPQSLDAEQSVIGACLLDAYALDQASEFLRPEDFYREAHAGIFRVMLDLRAAGSAVDLVTVSNSLRDAGIIDHVGGSGYLVACADVVPTTSNVGWYAAIVRETKQRRALIGFAEKVREMANDPPSTVAEVQDHLEAELMGIGSDRSDTAMPLPAAVDDADRILREGHSGMPLHVRKLSHVTMSDGLITLVMGHRGMGKSRFLFGEIIDKCRQGIPCLFISLEMPRTQVIHALIAIEIGIPLQELRTDINLFPSWRPAYLRACDAIKGWPLTVDDRTGRDVASIAAKCRRWKRESKGGLILVDYAQLIHGSGKDSVEKLNSVALGMQEAARQVNVPTILAAQITIVNQDGPLGGPEAHVKGSKTFEDAAENVIILNRPIKRMKPGDLHYAEWYGRAQANVTKNRNGYREGITDIGWREKIGVYCDTADDSPRPAYQPSFPIDEDNEPDYGDPFADDEQ